MDLAGSAVDFRRAMVENFQRPVFVGDEVSLYATILKVGRTSVTVKAEAFARRGRSGKKIQVTEGCLHLCGGGYSIKAAAGVKCSRLPLRITSHICLCWRLPMLATSPRLIGDGDGSTRGLLGQGDLIGETAFGHLADMLQDLRKVR